MPDQPRDPSTKDAQEVDRLLRKLILEEEERAPSAGPRPTPPPRPTAPHRPSALAVWGWVVLGAVLAGALTQWPYAGCGIPLAAYFLGVGLVLVTGVWAAYHAWRARLALPHILAIVLLFAGATLAAYQVLPRIGYAAVEATWRCPG